MREDRPAFKMGRLDHVHIRVPDRAEAARWYAEHLGFEPVAEFDFWANGFDGGPLQISADGGHTMLALFEASDGHPMVRQETGVAFSVDADTFIAFARSLPGQINNPDGQPLTQSEIVDFDLCWAYNLADPWGNQYEVNCYDYDTIKRELVDTDGVEPVRYWPAELYAAHPRHHRARGRDEHRCRRLHRAVGPVAGSDRRPPTDPAQQRAHRADQMGQTLLQPRRQARAPC